MISPAPWALTMPMFDGNVVVSKADNRVVATQITNKDDAKLIVAAPILLQALKTASFWLNLCLKNKDSAKDFDNPFIDGDVYHINKLLEDLNIEEAGENA